MSFLDVELETLRGEVLTKIGQLQRLEAYETFPKRNSPLGDDRQEVPPEWELDQAERYVKTVDAMDQAAIDVWEAYEALVRRGRAKLEP